MLTTEHLVEVADRFRVLTGIEEETTLSHRLFGDTKKLRQLREGSGITLERFNAAMQWIAQRWPEGHELPEALKAFCANPVGPTPAPQPKDAAA